MANDNEAQSSSPVLQLLASALQFWIRQQCDAVDSMDLQLHGSTLGLLRGRLSGVSLVARRVVFSSLEIERVELRSEAIQVQMGQLLKSRSLQLEHPFQIEGTAAFSGPGLSRSLCTPHWRPLGDQLAEGLLGLTPLQELTIERDCLVIKAQAMQCDTLPQAVNGGLELHGIGNNQSVALPSDPNINIRQASLDGGLLQLHGSARVSP